MKLDSHLKRIVVLLQDRCQPDVCSYACMKSCPVKNDRKNPKPNVIRVRKGTGKPVINSRLCINCGICIQKCFRFGPNAIRVVTVPGEIENELPIHSYGENSFRLFRICQLRKGMVVGLVGPNGIGKTTIMNILSGNLIPNQKGSFSEGETTDQKPNDVSSVLNALKTPGMKEFVKNILLGDVQVSYKKQVIEEILKQKISVEDILGDTTTVQSRINYYVDELELNPLLSREVTELSGGELQRLALGICFLTPADTYFFDEPCTFLDIRQRLSVAKLIRNLAHDENRFVLVAEHDVAVLDYLADLIHVVWGEIHAYGVVSRQMTVRKGINAFLLGRLPAENVLFRSKKITFRRVVKERDWTSIPAIPFDRVDIKLGKSFELTVERGELHHGEVLGVLGENGLGKSTFAKVLAGILSSDTQVAGRVSYKPQYIKRHDLSVLDFLSQYMKRYPETKELHLRLLKPLNIAHLLKKSLGELSGGELQRVYLAGALGKEADLYLIDEGSAFLDVEERLKSTRVIRFWAEKRKAAIIAIEHDLQIADAIADRLMLFFGEPGVKGEAYGPFTKREGMNRFLRSLEVTFRRDDRTGRARINKPNSRLDKQQKEIGEFYYEK